MKIISHLFDHVYDSFRLKGEDKKRGTFFSHDGCFDLRHTGFHLFFTLIDPKKYGGSQPSTDSLNCAHVYVAYTVDKKNYPCHNQPKKITCRRLGHHWSLSVRNGPSWKSQISGTVIKTQAGSLMLYRDRWDMPVCTQAITTTLKWRTKVQTVCVWEAFFSLLSHTQLPKWIVRGGSNVLFINLV